MEAEATVPAQLKLKCVVCLSNKCEDFQGINFLRPNIIDVSDDDDVDGIFKKFCDSFISKSQPSVPAPDLELGRELSLCSNCLFFISSALDTKAKVKEVEMEARNLQIEVESKLREVQIHMGALQSLLQKIQTCVKESEECHGERPSSSTTGLDNLPDGEISDALTLFRRSLVHVSNDVTFFRAGLRKTFLLGEEQNSPVVKDEVILPEPEQDHEIKVEAVSSDDETLGASRNYLKNKNFSLETEPDTLLPFELNLFYENPEELTNKSTLRTQQSSSCPQSQSQLPFRTSPRKKNTTTKVYLEEEDDDFQDSEDDRTHYVGKKSSEQKVKKRKKRNTNFLVPSTSTTTSPSLTEKKRRKSKSDRAVYSGSSPNKKANLVNNPKPKVAPPPFLKNCEICGRPFRHRPGLWKHLWTHKNEEEKSQSKSKRQQKILQCSTCGKRCDSITRLAQHEDIHKNDNEREKSVCPHCGKCYFYINQHISRAHKFIERRDERQNCYRCGQSLKNRMYLLRHIKRMHHSNPEDKPFCCEICGKNYKTKTDLYLHKKASHVDPSERPFACGNCGKSFSFKAHCRKHQTTCKLKKETTTTTEGSEIV